MTLSRQTQLVNGLAVAILVLLGGVSPGLAQNVGPEDVDFRVEPEKDQVGTEEFLVETTMAVRADGGQGWSYGAKHDPAVLEILDVTTVDTDTAATLSGGFDSTTISEDEGGTKVGFTQGVVLSFTMPVFVPVTDRFVMARATYKPVCSEETATSIDFTSDLSSTPGGPKVDVNFTVEGQGVVPAVLESGEITACAAAPTSLELRMEAASTDLPADQQSVVGVDIVAELTEGPDGLGAQAWSYAIRLDGTKVAVDDFGLGEDAAALKGGSGPDFSVTDPLDEDEDGTIDALIGGGVVDFGKAQDSVLLLPVGSPKKIGKAKLKSAITLAAGEDPQQTTLKFDTIAGGKKVSTIENLFTIDEKSVEPTLGPDVTITLVPGGEQPAAPFRRGDANDDARVDIADGIWIIQFLFYGGMEKPCKGAADANADNLVDIADAMYIFNYRLQPGATPGNLFPAPPAPFPGCGTDPELSAEDCPSGSTSCSR